MQGIENSIAKLSDMFSEATISGMNQEDAEEFKNLIMENAQIINQRILIHLVDQEKQVMSRRLEYTYSCVESYVKTGEQDFLRHALLYLIGEFDIPNTEIEPEEMQE